MTSKQNPAHLQSLLETASRAMELLSQAETLWRMGEDDVDLTTPLSILEGLVSTMEADLADPEPEPVPLPNPYFYRPYVFPLFFVSDQPDKIGYAIAHARTEDEAREIVLETGSLHELEPLADAYEYRHGEPVLIGERFWKYQDGLLG